MDVENPDQISGLKPVQQRLQVITDSGTLAMWEVDLRTGKMTWSARGEKLLGVPPDYDAENLEGLMKFVHADDRARVERVLAQCIAARVQQHHERFRIVRADGRVRHVSAYVEFVDEDERGPQKMVGFALDISDLAEYEERLRENDERLRTAYEAAKVWTWRIDLDEWTISRPLQTSDASSPQYGTKQSFEDWVEKVHPDDRARVESSMRRCISSGELWEDEFRLRWPDGNYHWIYDRGKRIDLPGGSAIFSGAAMVIDERKRVEQQLVENEERLRSAYLAGKMWPWELEISSGKLRRSDDFEGILGTGKRLITFSEWLEDVHPDDRERVQAAIDEAMTQAGTYSCEYRLRWSDGTYHWLNSRGGLIRDTRGTTKLMGIARDCTEEKETAAALEQSEQLRLVALEAAQMGVFFQDMNTGRIQWSERQFNLYGLAPAAFTGDREQFHQLVLPEDMSMMMREHERQVADRERKFRYEFRIRRPSDGKIRWLAAVGELKYDEHGVLTTMMGVNYDITDSKLHDAELRASERLRSIAIGAAEMGVWRQDLATGQVTWTDRQFELFGVPQDEFDGTANVAFRNMHPEDRVRLARECERVVTAHGSRHVTEFRILKPDGNVRWLAAVGEILYDDASEALQSVGVNFDITARKEQEESVRESERLRRLALSAARMGAFEWNVVTGEITWSPEQYQLLHLDPESCVPTLELFESRVHPDDLPQMQLLMQLLTGKQQKRYRNEFRIVWPDGSHRWIRTLGEFLYDAEGKVVRMFGVNWDVTEQKTSEEQIVQLNRELQHKVADFETLMNAMPVAVAMGRDPELRDVRVNPTFAQLLGLKDPNENVSVAMPRAGDAVFRIVRDGHEVPLDEYPQRKAARLQKEIRNEEFELITREGRRIDMFGHVVPMLDESGKVRGTLAAYMDITERKRAEQALRTSEKLATAGKMAASLAHEINNPLAAITNLLYLIGQDEAASDSSKRFIALASNELARVSQITRNVLAFYRETNQPIEVDLVELMSGVLELYSPKIRDSQVMLDYQRNGACKVIAYPGELRQVFSNLVVNAIDAMPNGGKLSIRIRQSYDRRNNRTGARMLVSDNGTGIPREKLERIFEPFFTTKGEKGTGLGLWVSRDIINKHDGSIRIRSSSEAGRSGTSFALFLPSESTAVRERMNRHVASVSSHST